MTDELIGAIGAIITSYTINQHIAVIAEEHRLIEFRPALRQLAQYISSRAHISRDTVEIVDLRLVIRLIAVEPLQQGNYCRIKGTTFDRILIDVLPDTLSDFSDDNLDSMLSELSCHMNEGKVEWFKS